MPVFQPLTDLELEQFRHVLRAVGATQEMLGKEISRLFPSETTEASIRSLVSLVLSGKRGKGNVQLANEYREALIALVKKQLEARGAFNAESLIDLIESVVQETIGESRVTEVEAR
ncbi:MAG: hypothetical protein KDA84_23675, partial [Planctomycetaceae bacterium]|nr:hypothetical protein [Planctomycetaceae bacterium]